MVYLVWDDRRLAGSDKAHERTNGCRERYSRPPGTSLPVPGQLDGDVTQHRRSCVGSCLTSPLRALVELSVSAQINVRTPDVRYDVMLCKKNLAGQEIYKNKSKVRGVARWWVLWRGKVVSFEVTFEGVKWWWDSDSSRYLVTAMRSSRGERMT